MLSLDKPVTCHQMCIKSVSLPILVDLYECSALWCFMCEYSCPFVLRGCHFWQLLTVKDCEDVTAAECFSPASSAGTLVSPLLSTRRPALLTSWTNLMCVLGAVRGGLRSHFRCCRAGCISKKVPLLMLRLNKNVASLCLRKKKLNNYPIFAQHIPEQ